METFSVLSKQSRCLWFETPSHSLWPHCDASRVFSALLVIYVEIQTIRLYLCCSQLPPPWLPRCQYPDSKDPRIEIDVAWWRHQMETFSALLALCVGIHRSPVNSPHKGQWRGALMFSLICVRINGWVNNGDAGDLRRQCAHYDVSVMDLRVFATKVIPSRRPFQQAFSALLTLFLVKKCRFSWLLNFMLCLYWYCVCVYMLV